MQKRLVRVGIDVGGTHTKAVALDNTTHDMIGKASVMTTHDHALGVAAGVVAAFEKCLKENGIDPNEVIFIAHSTTQATNALLEGDVAKVGVLGLAKGGVEKLFAKSQTKIPNIPLGTGKFIMTTHAYRNIKGYDEAAANGAIDELVNQHGAQVIVASKAFGVDNFTEEMTTQTAALKQNIPCTVASDITKMYGLTVRTRTATINASILPKMLETANSTQKSVLDTGIKAPLMMMRGDGGVMEVDEMKKRPVLTMLSGPAASVIGALMYLRASNGIYFEVGGTSTNIGVIKDGRPTVNYSVVGGHRTYISSLDVRVLGVAGGSLVRANNKSIADMGPRSSHIAGLPYSAFTPESEMEGGKLEFFRPKPEDPDDYVRIRLKNGRCVAITNTCAANVLGLVKPEYFAYGNAKSCHLAIAPLAEYLGVSVEETARQILQKSCEKITKIIGDLAFAYKLETDQSVLVGCGGGAAALIPFASQMMGLKYNIPENAEVISSIGVALAMVRDVVERVIPQPTTKDIAEIKHEAKMMAINSGAVPDSVEVHIEIDAQSQKVTAIAMGSTEVQTTDLLKECSPEEAAEIAAKSFGAGVSKLKLEATNKHLHVYSYNDGSCRQIRIIDKKGFIKIQRRDGEAHITTIGESKAVIDKLWKQCTLYRSDVLICPDIFVLIDSRILEFSGMQDISQVFAIYATELLVEAEDKSVIVVGTRNNL